MAELMIRTFDQGDREEGDVTLALNDRRIHHCHAEMICHRRKIGFNSDGLRARATLAEAYYIRTHQYRFERDGLHVKRTELATGNEVVFGKTAVEADGKMQAIDVVQFLTKALRNDGHKIFGTKGNEVWYGGAITTDNLSQLWSDIEGGSDKRIVDHGEYPFTRTELRRWLVAPVVDFDDDERVELESPEYEEDNDGNPILDDDGGLIVLKHRRNSVALARAAQRLGLRLRDIKDPDFEIDIRRTAPRQRKNDIAERKVRGNGRDARPGGAGINLPRGR